MPPCVDREGAVRQGGCPKVHWTKEQRSSLTDKNYKTLQVYREVQAGGVSQIPMDRLLARNLAIVDLVIKEAERYHLSQMVGGEVALKVVEIFAATR